MNWSTADVADVYRRRGEANPVQAACGSGRSKYGVSPKENRTVDGIVFDSKAEACAYKALSICQNRGMLSKLKLQPKFLLQDKFTDAQGKRHRAIRYVSDFSFVRDGKNVAVEVKGFETRTWRIKEKLFRMKYPGWTLEVWK